MKNLLETLERYYNEGWLIKQTHPELPLTIWNYSQTTQYEGKWDEVTLMCRGLVTDNETGEIVGRPFKKFFNWEENKHTPTKDFEVFTKEDGSLGIAFNYKGNWIFASRGSFTSEQIIWATDFINDNLINGVAAMFNEDFTYLFEIVYKSNRIVVNYGDYEGLILLGAINTKTGEELSYDKLLNYGYFFDVVKRYDGITDYTTLKGMIGDNEEGFVIRFSNGDRMKIKGEEYLRLHRIMTGVSTTSVWEIMANGGNMEEILKDVPDEFYDKIKEVVRDIAVRFDNIRTDYIQYFTDIVFKIGREDRRRFAEEARRYKHSSILFALLDGKDITPIIWKIVKPEWRKL
jgi:T4 RnlA family RNA ligase